MSEWQICPVCIGKGLLPQGFYNPIGTYTSSSTTPEKCRACNGSGVLLT